MDEDDEALVYPRRLRGLWWETVKSENSDFFFGTAENK